MNRDVLERALIGFTWKPKATLKSERRVINSFIAVMFVVVVIVPE
jgi:hypothetical protein